MRIVFLATAFAGTALLGACSSMDSSGGAAAEIGQAAALTPTASASVKAEQSNELSPAANAAQGGEVVQASSTADANKRICKSIKPIGSIRPKRVCSTQAEWDQFASKTGESADKFNELRRSGSLEPAREGQQFPPR